MKPKSVEKQIRISLNKKDAAEALVWIEHADFGLGHSKSVDALVEALKDAIPKEDQLK